MRCPLCNYAESKVIDSRAAEDNSTIRRRRECHQCGARFTTFEMIEKVPLMVRTSRIRAGEGLEWLDEGLRKTSCLGGTDGRDRSSGRARAPEYSAA